MVAVVSRYQEDALAVYAQEIIQEILILPDDIADRLEERLDASPDFQAILDREMDAIATDGLADDLACFRLTRKARKIVRAYAPVLDHNLLAEPREG